jgi:hypothetical protein
MSSAIGLYAAQQRRAHAGRAGRAQGGAGLQGGAAAPAGGGRGRAGADLTDWPFWFSV